MTAEHVSDVPDEVSVTVARVKFSELVEAAAAGKVIHLTKHGVRIAALVPEGSPAELDEEFMAAGVRIRERYRDVFDRLADM